MDNDQHTDENGHPEDIWGNVPDDAWLIREQMKARRDERPNPDHQPNG